MGKSISVLSDVERQIMAATGVSESAYLNTKLRTHGADGDYSDEIAGADGAADHKTLLSRANDHISCAMDDDDDMPPRERIGRAMKCLSAALETLPEDGNDGSDAGDAYSGSAHVRHGVRFGGR